MKGRTSLRYSILITLLLAGCATGPAPRPNISSYDFGIIDTTSQPASVIDTLEVHAPSWLSTTAMQYRMSDTDPARRLSYAESRWVAPPAELMEIALKRYLPANGNGQGCRLRLDLDEFVQTFEGADRSRAQVSLRATLTARHGDTVLAHHNFNLDQPAGRDAKAGVAAYSSIQRQLASSLTEWLKLTAENNAGMTERCRS